MVPLSLPSQRVRNVAPGTATTPGQVKLLTDYAVNGLDKPGIITANALFCQTDGAAYCTDKS